MFLDKMNQEDGQVEAMEMPKRDPLAFWREATQRQRAILIACIVALLALTLYMQSNLRSNGQVIRSLSDQQTLVLK